MKSNVILEILKKFKEYDDYVNESTSTGDAGSYRAPLRPGLKLWDKNILKPFTEPLNGYDNAEVYVDSLDGNIDTKGVKRKEKISVAISKSDIELGLKKWRKQELDPFSDDSNHHTTSKAKKKNIKNNIKKTVGVWEKHPESGYEIPSHDVHTINEDLGVWFGTKKKPKGSKQPKGPWVNICKKVDGKHPPCGRPDASSKSYPKCRAAGVAGKMSDSQKKAACQQKRRAEKKDTQTGKGQKPVMTSYKPKKKKTNESVLISLIRKALD